MMRRFRNVIAIAGLLAVAVALLVTVTRWPVEDDSRPIRAALWGDPLPPDLATVLRAGGVEPVEWPSAESWPDPLINHEVDLLLAYNRPATHNGVTVSGGSLKVEYDAERRSSLLAVERLDRVMQRYNLALAGQMQFSVSRRAVGMDDPESWHLFFGGLTPLLVLAALALGTGLGGTRWQCVARAEVFVLFLALGLNSILPSFPFHTTPSHAVTWYWANIYFPWMPAFLAALTLAPAITLTMALPQGRARWLRIAIAFIGAVALALTVAHLLDLDTSSWPTSRVPYEVTLPALVLCALANYLIAQTDGSRERMRPADGVAERDR